MRLLSSYTCAEMGGLLEMVREGAWGPEGVGHTGVGHTVGAFVNSRPRDTEEAGGRGLPKGEHSASKTKWNKSKLRLLCYKAKGQRGPGLSHGPGAEDTCPGWPALTLLLQRYSLCSARDTALS